MAVIWKRKQKEFVCETCGKDFSKISQVKKHCKDTGHKEKARHDFGLVRENHCE